MKSSFQKIVLSVGLEVCDRKFSQKVGKVIFNSNDEVKVQWSDGTIWSYVGQNQKFLKEYSPNTPKVFQKVS